MKLLLPHKKLIAISGTIWLLTGLFLLQYGVRLLISALPLPDPFVWGTHPLIEFFSPFLGSRENVAALIVLGCLITGKLKCRYVLSRSIDRGVQHILSLPNPSPVYRLYSARYYLLIAVMITMGFFLRNSGAPSDFRAACYLSIGFGMIHGSMIFFKKSLVIGNALQEGKSSVDLLD